MVILAVPQLLYRGARFVGELMFCL